MKIMGYISLSEYSTYESMMNPNAGGGGELDLNHQFFASIC